MACERPGITDWHQTSRDSLTKRNKKEVKRHFDKLPPPPKLRTIGSKNPTKQYPGVLETTWTGVEAVAAHRRLTENGTRGGKMFAFPLTPAPSSGVQT
eukprot:544405-Rhodomonas_salina.1